MKKYLLVFAFALALPCLWAADDFVYDTVVTGTRFTHGTGFRFGLENTQGTVQVRELRSTYNPISGWQNTWFEDEKDWIVTFMNPGLTYQAEWKYFMLDIAPGWAFWNGNHEQMNSPGLSVQPMARYPVVDNQKLRYTVLMGPNFLVNIAGIDISANLSQELGVKINDRFMPFLGFGLGVPLAGGSMTEEVITHSYNDTKNFNPGPPRICFQITLGLKTMVLEDVFYYRGKEVHRRRR
ncbi:MAG: hypothetical protein LBD96_07980 [Treponema sp.]|jgi:opacity protein-like surface antigen|nr:hypothetical protein [Treponema sp.]